MKTAFALPGATPGRDTLRAQLTQRLASRHTGRANGIKAELLALALGVHERTLRDLISSARDDGVAIVGTPETGYYIAVT
ncbi:MAG: HTH domain-containing protein, partial [Burkholderiales bacterium]|nr:HTH domain-containing protein [Burkholderiales bacterium]